MTSCRSGPCLGFFAAELTILQPYLLSDPTLFQGPDLTATKTLAEHNPLKLGNALWILVDHPLGLE